MTSVDVDGVTIGDGSSIEEIYTLTSITGWQGGVDFQRERTPRPAKHGEFSAQSWKSGRLVRVEFEVLTPASRGVTHVDAIDRVLAILEDGTEGELAVTDNHGRRLTAEGSRWGEPEIVENVEGFLSAVALRFLVPDPRRYGDTKTFDPASSLTLFHYGNTAALPDLRVTGPSNGYVLEFSTGDVVRVPGNLGASESDALSGATQWVKRTGVVGPLNGVTGHVPEIPRGKDVTVTLRGARAVAGTVQHTYT